MAALDKRLQAHQEAFQRWRKLVAYAHGEEVGPLVMECQSWWEENCLYLEPAARIAFSDAYTFAATHRKMNKGGQFMDERARAELGVRFWPSEAPALRAGVRRANARIDSRFGSLAKYSANCINSFLRKLCWECLCLFVCNIKLND